MSNSITEIFEQFRTAATVAGFQHTQSWRLFEGDEGNARPWMLARETEANTAFPRVLGYTLEEAEQRLTDYAVTLKAVAQYAPRMTGTYHEARADRFELDEI